MKFLSKKGFNPQNMHNQKRVWEAKESKKQEEQKIRERTDQLKRERDDEELSKARGEPIQLKFMYKPPPGLEAAGAKEESSPDDVVSSPLKRPAKATTDITQTQAGDDPAAAAFRKMLAAAASGQVEDGDEDDQKVAPNHRICDGTVLQGTSIEKELKGKGGLSALEKAVGRRDGNQSLSLDEQVARFPQLRDAPMAKGMNGSNVGVSFKPLGAQLRNVRCLACGVWGHSRGERECQKSGWNPFAAPITAAAVVPSAKQQEKYCSTEVKRSKRDDRSSQSSHSESGDSYRERKQRKKSKRHKRESKRSRKNHRSESLDRISHRRSRSESSAEDRSRSRKFSKKSRRKERR